MYTYSIESELVIWDVTSNWREAIDSWSSTRLSLTCDDVAIHVTRDGVLITVLENKKEIKNHSDFLMAVGDASNRVEGRIMMDMYEQEENGMNVIEPKDKLDLPKEWQEPYAAYMMRKTKEETNYGIELPLTDDLSDTTTTLDFHGKFEEMDDDTQDAIINPKHYKMIPKEAYVAKPEGLGYVDLMEYILTHHKGVESYLLGQVFKYACTDLGFQGDFPKHYKIIPKEAYVAKPEGLEYMDLMEYILAHHKGVESHLLGQVFKYACRLGKKDAKLQDAKKIAWYANRFVTVRLSKEDAKLQNAKKIAWYANRLVTVIEKGQ
jgi:hypothetical protein